MFYIVSGAVLGLAPRALVCPMVSEHGYMRCWETARFMTLIGIGMVMIGLVMWLSSSLKIRAGFHGFAAAASMLGILIPMKLVGGCMDANMACNAVAFPVIYAVSSVIALAAAAFMIRDILTLRMGITETVCKQSEK